MTRHGQEGQKQHNAGGEGLAEGTDFMDKEAHALNVGPGRGAREVPGAHPSDKYVREHVEGMAVQGPDLLDPEHPTIKEGES